MNFKACSKIMLCVVMLLGPATAHAAPHISARKLGGLEIGFAEGNLMASHDGSYLALLSLPGEKGSNCFVFERSTHKTILVPGSGRMEPLVFARRKNQIWVWGLERDGKVPGLEKVSEDTAFIALYDLPKRKFVRAFTGEEWDVPSDVAISRDGSTLIVSDQEGWVRAFHATSEKLQWKKRVAESGGAPVSVALNSDGSRFLRWTDEDESTQQSTQVVSTRSGRVLQTLRLKLKGGLQSAFQGGRFAPSGEMVAVFQPDTQQWVFFDSRTGRAQWKMGAKSRSSEGDLDWQWSPDARFVAVCGPNRFELRDARNGRVLRAVSDEKKVWGSKFGAPTFSPDGSFLYVLSGNDSGFGDNNTIWQLRLHGTAAQVKADEFYMKKVRAEEERFALSPQHINQSLLQAAKIGDDKHVAFLLDKGANIETHNEGRRTPLMIAVTSSGFENSGSRRFQETIRLLIARGARVKRDGGFLLASAASRGNDELIRVLLKRGVDVNSDAKAYGTSTALSAAIDFGRTSSVKLLLDNGAAFNARNNKEKSPLWGLASSNFAHGNEVSIARLLIDKGASLNARTLTSSDENDIKHGGETALGEAAWSNKTALVEFLLERGADANTIDAQGQTPLMKVAQYEKDEVAVDAYNSRNLANRLKIVRALLAHGAKLELRDKEKQRAFDRATSPELKAALKIPREAVSSKSIETHN